MYKAVIGLEVHLELNTKSKMFSPSKNSYSLEPNTNVTPIDVAFPGTMPTVNEEAIRSAIKLANALNLTISDSLLFDRKNYYYPDLPKGFQITQMTKPLGKNGCLKINLNGNEKDILIHQMHIEEDAASFEHVGTNSLIDYNRVGVPLLEIVTEPCMNSREEAIEFLETLRNIIKYLEISDADQSKGQIRCDVNVSIMKESDTEFGVRAEVKNINSFTSVSDTIEYEIKRQIEVLQNGGQVLRETRRYSLDDKKTYSMREKVDAIDYKYYVEPNIPEIKITESFINESLKDLPMLPTERFNKYINEYSLTIVEAKTLIKEKNISDFFEKTLECNVTAKEASNWITTRLIGYLNKENKNIDDIFMKPNMLASIIKFINNKTISTEQAKQVFELVLTDNKTPEQIIEIYGMKQISDEDQINVIINKILLDNKEQVELYKSGKTNIFGFLVGQVLKSSGGKANPSVVSDLLRKELENDR